MPSFADVLIFQNLAELFINPKWRLADNFLCIQTLDDAFGCDKSIFAEVFEFSESLADVFIIVN